MGEVPGRAVAAPATAAQAKGADLAALIDTTVVGLFGLVAVATAHEHWLKDRVDVLPITEPLKAAVKQLPPKTLKKLEKNLAPAMVVAGLAIVVGPDVAVEMRLRAEDKRARAAVSQPPTGSRNGNSPVAAQPGVPAGVGGANGRSTGGGGWSDSVPSGPFIQPEIDA